MCPEDKGSVGLKVGAFPLSNPVVKSMILVTASPPRVLGYPSIDGILVWDVGVRATVRLCSETGLKCTLGRICLNISSVIFGSLQVK